MFNIISTDVYIGLIWCSWSVLLLLQSSLFWFNFNTLAAVVVPAECQMHHGCSHKLLNVLVPFWVCFHTGGVGGIRCLKRTVETLIIISDCNVKFIFDFWWSWNFCCSSNNLLIFTYTDIIVLSQTLLAVLTVNVWSWLRWTCPAALWERRAKLIALTHTPLTQFALAAWHFGTGRCNDEVMLFTACLLFIPSPPSIPALPPSAVQHSPAPLGPSSSSGS